MDNAPPRIPPHSEQSTHLPWLLEDFSAVQSKLGGERASIDAPRCQCTATILYCGLDGCSVDISGWRAVRQSYPAVGIFFIIRDSVEKVKNNLNDSDWEQIKSTFIMSPGIGCLLGLKTFTLVAGQEQDPQALRSSNFQILRVLSGDLSTSLTAITLLICTISGPRLLS